MRRLIIRLLGVSFGVGVALLLFSGVAFGQGYQAHAATARPGTMMSFRNTNRINVRNVRVNVRNVRINHPNLRIVHQNARIVVRRNVRVNVRVNVRTNVLIRTNRFPIFSPFGFGQRCTCCRGFGPI